MALWVQMRKWEAIYTRQARLLKCNSTSARLRSGMPDHLDTMSAPAPVERYQNFQESRI